jgi:hypothetical protein
MESGPMTGTNEMLQVEWKGKSRRQGQALAEAETRRETGRGQGKGGRDPLSLNCVSLGPLQSANLRKKRELRASIHKVTKYMVRTPFFL